MLFKLPHITLWHLLPIAIGVHGLLFAIPIPSLKKDVTPAKPEPSASVAVIKIPKPSPSLVAAVQPKPSPTVQPPPSPRPVQSAVPASPQPLTSPTPKPTPSPSPSPSASPSPSPDPTPSPTDGLQITGATPGCNGREACWQIGESNGRSIAGTLEQQLQQQGYTLTQKDLDHDTGFRVYAVEKDGVTQYYLHLIWSDRGTSYLRNPELLSYNEVTTLTGL